jgi:hypothetical protein
MIRACLGQVPSKGVTVAWKPAAKRRMMLQPCPKPPCLVRSPPLRLPTFALLALLAGPALAQAPAPDAATLLFETPQLRDEAPGTTLAYAYSRKAPEDGRLGPAFADTIRLGIDRSDAEPAARTVRMELFGPGRRRPAGPFEDVTTNPVLTVFLEHHVEQLGKALRANPRYLKNAIRAGLRDKAVVERAETEAAGRTVPAWRVSVSPFAEDANKDRMQGLDNLAYTFTVSDAVPGRIAAITVRAARPEGALFEETLTYARNPE